MSFRSKVTMVVVSVILAVLWGHQIRDNCTQLGGHLVHRICTKDGKILG